MNNIWKIESGKPGPVVAIMGGVHGNEPVGAMLVDELRARLKLDRGVVYLIKANPEALAQGVRQVGKNLNRCFVAGNNGTAPEDVRAREIMTVLDGCKALLDVHAYNDPAGDPFVICEEPALAVAQTLGCGIISTGWAAAEPGASDGYMYEQGKLGICYECGPLSQPEATLPAARLAAAQFVRALGLVDGLVVEVAGEPRVIHAERSVKRAGDDFWLDPALKSFERLEAGREYGWQGGERYVAAEGEVIIFPRSQAPVGSEAFIIGRETS